MFELQLQEEKRGEGMNLSIYQCDKCGVDCSKYEERVVVSFPFGEQHDLCIKCARGIFQPKEESEAE